MGKKREEEVVKAKPAKAYTRAQAERAMTTGVQPPTKFLSMEDPFQRPDSKDPGRSANHGNYHVRNKAWKMMGRPIPEGWKTEDEEKFFASIHYNPTLTEDVESVPLEVLCGVGEDVTT